MYIPKSGLISQKKPGKTYTPKTMNFIENSIEKLSNNSSVNNMFIPDINLVSTASLFKNAENEKNLFGKTERTINLEIKVLENSLFNDNNLSAKDIPKSGNKTRNLNTPKEQVIDNKSFEFQSNKFSENDDFVFDQKKINDDISFSENSVNLNINNLENLKIIASNLIENNEVSKQANIRQSFSKYYNCTTSEKNQNLNSISETTRELINNTQDISIHDMMINHSKTDSKKINDKILSYRIHTNLTKTPGSQLGDESYEKKLLKKNLLTTDSKKQDSDTKLYNHEERFTEQKNLSHKKNGSLKDKYQKMLDSLTKEDMISIIDNQDYDLYVPTINLASIEKTSNKKPITHSAKADYKRCIDWSADICENSSYKQQIKSNTKKVNNYRKNMNKELIGN